jgi:hypothetical protein
MLVENGHLLHLIACPAWSRASTQVGEAMCREARRGCPRIKVRGLKAHEMVTQPQRFYGSYDPEESYTGRHTAHFWTPATHPYREQLGRARGSPWRRSSALKCGRATSPRAAARLLYLISISIEMIPSFDD